MHSCGRCYPSLLLKPFPFYEGKRCESIWRSHKETTASSKNHRRFALNNNLRTTIAFSDNERQREQKVKNCFCSDWSDSTRRFSTKTLGPRVSLQQRHRWLAGQTAARGWQYHLQLKVFPLIIRTIFIQINIYSLLKLIPLILTLKNQYYLHILNIRQNQIAIPKNERIKTNRLDQIIEQNFQESI